MECFCWNSFHPFFLHIFLTNINISDKHQHCHSDQYRQHCPDCLPHIYVLHMIYSIHSLLCPLKFVTVNHNREELGKIHIFHSQAFEGWHSLLFLCETIVDGQRNQHCVTSVLQQRSQSHYCIWQRRVISNLKGWTFKKWRFLQIKNFHLWDFAQPTTFIVFCFRIYFAKQKNKSIEKGISRHEKEKCIATVAL